MSTPQSSKVADKTADTVRADTETEDSNMEIETVNLNKKRSSLNENLIDNNSSASSSSGQRLKIVIEDDTDGQSNKADSDKSDKTEEKKNKNKSESEKEEKKEKSDRDTKSQYSNDSDEPNESHNTSQDSSSIRNSGQKRTINRGLDGGYWSRMSMGEMLSENKPKRKRHAVERLNLSLNSRDSMFAINDSYLDDAENLRNEDSNQGPSTPASNRRSTGKHSQSAPSEKRYVLFPSKMFLTVRNETSSFFLCQTINKIYEDSKRCRIQWLEGENKDNLYVYGQNDWIDPNTIISKVNVIKRTKDKSGKKLDETHYEIIEEDAKKVSDLLDVALKEGGIEHIIERVTSSSDEDSEPKKTASEILEDKDYYDKEEEDENEKIKKKSSKKKKKKSEISSSSSAGSSSSSSSDEEVTKPKQIRHKSPPQKKPKSFEEYLQQKKKSDSFKKPMTQKNGLATSHKTPQDGTLKKKTDEASVKSLTQGKLKPNESRLVDPTAKSLKPAKSSIEITRTRPALSSPAEPKKIKLLDYGDEKKAHKTQATDSGAKDVKKMKPPKVRSDNDTDHLDSDDASSKNKKVESKKKVPSPKETINIKKIPVQDNAVNNSIAVSSGNGSKKRRLFKVISNRYLDPNPKVTVYAKDPFFEEANNESQIPFISAYVQSKLAFKALHLGDTAMLKRLIDDVDNVPSVHVEKSLCSQWIPAEYALYLENKEALEMLIDNFVNEASSTGKKRVEMPETMFEKFSNGSYNPRSLGSNFTLKLTESRGVKEGNNAFTKDSSTTAFVHHHNLITFFKRLFDVLYEHGANVEFFDFLLAKFHGIPSMEQYSPHMNIIEAILFGHRKLAGHVLKNCLNGYGFNPVHIEVLNAENDEDLKCKLRANMCTKKPFGNDLVTPIHCACINPNVKYLKTLLSITQEYNIADKKGRKPIHYAAVCEGLSPLEYLISRVSPYELDSNGSIPLHYACLAGRCINVEMLLSHARLKQQDDSTVTTEIIMDNKYGLGGQNKPNRKGQLPIHLAISRNNYDCIKVLIKYGSNLEYPLPNSKGKITPLMYACQLGHQKIVQLLIENHAKVEARDRHQRTAAIHAAMCGHSRTLSYLLRLGANPSVCDSSGNSCLHYACAYGWYYCVKILLDAGAQVNVLNDWKLTPFGTAFLKGHVGLCDQLLNLYPKQIDINFRTEDGETLVMLSVSSAGSFNKAAVKQLEYIVTKLGGNCQLVDSKGSNAFHYLASNLIDKQAIERQVASNATNRPKLIENMYQEHSKYRNQIAEILMKNNCNPNAENSEFETPFFTAISNLNHSFARYLLEKMNVKITARQSPNGKTLLSLMAEKCIDIDICSIVQSSSQQFEKYISEFKKMAQIKNETGLTPFQIACIKLNEATTKGNLKNIKNINKFITFLYRDCESNPNELIKVENSDNPNTQLYSGTDKNEMNNTTDKNKEKKFFTIPPIFLILNDKHVELIEELIKAMNQKSELVKFDLINFYDKNGLTPLLKACVQCQSRVVLKLFERNVFSLDEIVAQKSQNNSYLNENILQLAIRFDQIEVFENCLDLFMQSKSESIANEEKLLLLLAHTNSEKQNFLHALTLLEINRELFNSLVLVRIFEKMFKFFTKKVEFSAFLSKMLGSGDKSGRNVFHLLMLNFDRRDSSDIDLEMFFLEQIFSLDDTFNMDSKFTAPENSFSKKIYFQSKDAFGRLPLHYLFIDANIYEINSTDEEEEEEGEDEGKDEEEEEEGKPSIYSNQKKSETDPVEILTVLIKNMDKESLDEQDLAGFTTLHYAAIRGATISCTLLISHDCQIDKCDLNRNTPISSAIYYKRATCVLTLLRSMTDSRKKDPNAKAYCLKNYYYLHENLSNVRDKGEKEPNLYWKQLVEKDLHPCRRISLYKLILSNKWEGILWLVLGDLGSYGLDQFDAIQAAVLSNEFNLAIRLLKKFLQQTKDPLFRIKLCTHVCDENNGSTLLHLIGNCNLPVTMHESVKQFLGLIFKTPDSEVSVPDIGLVKSQDKHGSTAFHYACHMHNFAFIDFMLENFKNNGIDLFICKDSINQSAYGLLFWQVGRIVYSKETKEKIKHYTLNYVKKNDNFEFMSRAYYPLTDSFLSSPITGKLLKDYPSLTKKQFISPLVYVLNRQDCDMTKFLIKDLGFNVNTCDSTNKCALVYAIQTNNIRLCQLLLNPDFEMNVALEVQETVASGKTKKVAMRIKNLFKVKKASDTENSSDDETEVENNDESLNDTRDDSILAVNNQTDVDSEFSKFEVTSKIILNQQDNKNKSIFHHLSCSLEYGSFHNVDICRLLFAAFNFNVSHQTSVGTNSRVIPVLTDFLKRVDSKLVTASEYALRNGNIALYEELQKTLNPLKPLADDLVVNKVTITDKFYELKKPAFIEDSSMFLKKFKENKENMSVENLNECFKVDPLSNMSKTGTIVWDEKSNVPFDVVLTKTDVTYGLFGMHNFYKMQLITQNISTYGIKQSNIKSEPTSKDATNGEKKFDPSQMCVLFTRWGRIGDQGQYQRTPFSSFKEARDEFCKIFKQKTANDFNDTVLEKKKSFESKPKRYTLIKLESRKRTKLRDLTFELFDNKNKKQIFEKSMFQPSKDYMEFLSDLLDVNFIKKQIDATQLSAEYLPISQLTTEAIETAQDILNSKLKPAIERRMELEKLNKKENLMEYMALLDQINKLSNDFYDLIPQMNYNYEKLPPISTEKELDEQVCTINKLNNAHIAIRILMGARFQLPAINPFDYVYRSLNIKLQLMELNIPETQYILRYISPSESYSKFSIKRIFKFERADEAERFEKAKLPTLTPKQKNRYLLWHGTGTENMISIMSMGLLKSPRDAKFTGNSYGKGIYFSDSFEASSNYSNGLSATINKERVTRKYMLLCEVALGKVKELKDYYEQIESLPSDFDSVKVVGTSVPDSKNNISMPNGAICPLGEPISSKSHYWGRSKNNQYVVYNESQVVIRYIVQYYDSA